jgi:hypothetical protein
MYKFIDLFQIVHPPGDVGPDIKHVFSEWAYKCEQDGPWKQNWDSWSMSRFDVNREE